MQTNSVTNGVFTPGKSASSLDVDFFLFCLVWFAFTLPFLQVNHTL